MPPAAASDATVPRPTASAPRRRRKEARPGELTAAALELFVEKGFAATRLEDVAARAGVSKGTLYLYFDSKESLFRAVIEEGMVASLSAAEQLLSEYQGPADELLRQLLFGWWEQIGGTRLAGIPKLMVAEANKNLLVAGLEPGPRAGLVIEAPGEALGILQALRDAGLLDRFAAERAKPGAAP